MKVSKTVRWILVLPAMLATLYAGAFVFYLFPEMQNSFWGVVFWSVSLLTGIMVAPLNGSRFITIMAVLFLLACLFPPWLYTFYETGTRDFAGMRSEQNAGYHFILTPPEPLDRHPMYGVKLDVVRLVVEWVCILAVSGLVLGMARITKDKPGGRPKKFRDYVPLGDDYVKKPNGNGHN